MMFRASIRPSTPAMQWCAARISASHLSFVCLFVVCNPSDMRTYRSTCSLCSRASLCVCVCVYLSVYLVVRHDHGLFNQHALHAMETVGIKYVVGDNSRVELRPANSTTALRAQWRCTAGRGSLLYRGTHMHIRAHTHTVTILGLFV